MAQVIKGYECSYPNPLKINEGQEIKIIPKDLPSKWPGWHWCEDQKGNSGWISENYFIQLAEKTIVTKQYDGRELSVNKKDKVNILFEDHGWVWCRDLKEEIGWLPTDSIKFTDIEDLNSFIVQAKANGWVGVLNEGRKIPSSRKGSLDIIYKKGCPFQWHKFYVFVTENMGYLNN